MASARHRVRRSLSQRTLQHDLQGSRDALIAFDGFEPLRPPVAEAVLQRPAGIVAKRRWPQWLLRARSWWMSLYQR